MSYKGQHPRDPYRKAASEDQIQQNWSSTFPQKTREQKEKEKALIVAGFTDLYLRHDDCRHPEVKRYYARHLSYRKSFDAVISLREGLREGEG